MFKSRICVWSTVFPRVSNDMSHYSDDSACVDGHYEQAHVFQYRNGHGLLRWAIQSCHH